MGGRKGALRRESFSVLRSAVGRDWKGKLSPALYLIGIALAFWRPWSAQLLYVLAALLWLIPDRRIKGTLRGRAGDGG